MKTPFLWASLAGLPLLGAAQTAPSTPIFYLGVGASVLTDVVFRPTSYSPIPALVGPALTLGMQFTPRLGAQVGVAYAWRTNGNPDTDVFSSYRVRRRVFSIPLLLRYSLLPVTSRFHVDALGGITLLRSSTSFDYQFNFYSGYTSSSRSGELASTRKNLTLGPALRYSLTPQLELSATPLANMSFDETYSRFRDRLFWNALAGVNYTFNR